MDISPHSGLVDQSDDAGTLDRDTEHLLMLQAGAGDAARQDFSLGGLKFLQGFSILEIDIIDFGFAKAANFRLGRLSSAGTSFLHLYIAFRLKLYCLLETD